MNSYPLAFQSPLLAQKKLLENFAALKQNDRNCGTIRENPCEDTMTSITTVPLFHRDFPISCERDHNIPIQDLRELLVRAAKRAYEKELNSETGRQTLAKATRYNIPFDSNDIDFLDLMDKIADYEHLLERAEELAVDWDESNYDIIGLEEELEIASSDPERTSNDYHELRRDYYASIAL